MSEPNISFGSSNAPRLESMSFGMILDRTINLFFKNFGLLVGIIVVPQILIRLSGLLYTNLISHSFDSDSFFRIYLYLPFIMLIYLLIFSISSSAVTVAISSRYLGKEITIVRAYKIAFRRLGVLLGAWIVAVILIFLGYFLFVIPGIILMILFSLLTPVVMLESLTASQSRKRARELIKGHCWKAFWLLVIYYALYYAIYYGLCFLAGLFSGFIMNFPYSTIAQLINAVLSIVTAPIPAIIIILVYYNQRIRKEGFDLALLAEALAEE